MPQNILGCSTRARPLTREALSVAGYDNSTPRRGRGRHAFTREKAGRSGFVLVPLLIRKRAFVALPGQLRHSGLVLFLKRYGNRRTKGTHIGMQNGPTGVQGYTCRDGLP